MAPRRRSSTRTGNRASPSRYPRRTAFLSIEPIPLETRKKCRACNTSDNYLWRSGPDGPSTLCNLCGQRLRNLELPVYISPKGTISASHSPGARLAAVTGAQRHRWRNHLDWSRPLVVPETEQTQNCLACNRSSPPRLMSGPDGPQTICSACYERFRKKKLPLFQKPDGKITAAEGKGARLVRHVGFDMELLADAGLVSPIIEPLEEQQAAADSERARAEGAVENIMSGGNDKAPHVLSDDMLHIPGDPVGGQVSAVAKHQDIRLNQSSTQEGRQMDVVVMDPENDGEHQDMGLSQSRAQGGKDEGIVVVDPENDGEHRDIRVNQSSAEEGRDEDTVEVDPENDGDEEALVDERGDEVAKREPEAETQPGSTFSYAPQPPPAPESLSGIKAIMTEGVQDDGERGIRSPVAGGRVAKSSLALGTRMKTMLVKARYYKASESCWITRRFPLHQRLSFAALHAHLTKTFKAENGLSIRYQDNEGDDVTVSSDLEITELYREFLEHGLRPVRMTLQ